MKEIKKPLASTVDVKLLKSLLTTASKLKNTVLPILDCIKISDKTGYITDLENAMVIPNIFPEGDAIIEIKVIKEILSSIKEPTILMHIENGVLFINTSRNKYKIPSFDDIGSYPKDIVFNLHDSISINITKEDRETILNASEFIGHDELRPALMHVKLGEQIVATDAHTLYFNTSNNLYMNEIGYPMKEKPGIMKLNNQELISEMTIDVIRSQKECPIITIPTLFENEVDNTPADKSYISLQFNNFTWIQRRLITRYPNYKAVIPTDFKTTVLIDKKDLLEAIDASKWVWKNHTTKRIILTFMNDNMALSCKDFDFDREFQCNYDCKMTGESITIWFNGEFLQKIVSLSDDPVLIELISDNRAAIINKNMLIMPLQIKD